MRCGSGSVTDIEREEVGGSSRKGKEPARARRWIEDDEQSASQL